MSKNARKKKSFFLFTFRLSIPPFTIFCRSVDSGGFLTRPVSRVPDNSDMFCYRFLEQSKAMPVWAIEDRTIETGLLFSKNIVRPIRESTDPFQPDPYWKTSKRI
jgi:hypothetical protein